MSSSARISKRSSRASLATLGAADQNSARIEMLKRGLTTAHLAAKTGMSIFTVRSLMNGLDQSRRGQVRLEQILGPVWTPPEQAAEDAILEQILGKHPALIHIHELRLRADAFGIAWCNGSGPIRKGDLLKLIRRHCGRGMAHKSKAPAARRKEGPNGVK